MRVVSGTARGRKLKAVPGDTTRPILDRVKTALFDIIRHRLPGQKWLDLFAGSGGVGIEALSQGAEHCVFVDVVKEAVSTIRENLAATHLAEKAQVRHIDAFQFIRKSETAFDTIFVAPPQYKNLWVEAMHCIAERPSVVAKDGEIIDQIDPSEYEALTLSAFREREQRKYGATLLIFFEKISEATGDCQSHQQ